MTFAGALLTLMVVAGLEVRLQPGGARPGDVVLVEVTGATAAPSGQLGSAELVFLPYGERWVALVGLSVDHKPGVLGLEVTGKTTAGKERLEGELEVRKPEFRRRQLTVSKRFTSLSKKDRLRSAEDQKAFDETFDRDFEPWVFEARFAWPRLDDVSAPFGAQLDVERPPVGRVGGPFSPVPFAPALEQHWVPDATSIAEGIRQAVARPLLNR